MSANDKKRESKYGEDSDSAVSVEKFELWIWAKNGSNKFFWKNTRTIQGPPIDSTKIPD